MKVVIQCAASKARGAGYMTTENGRQVVFVADPKLAPAADNYLYARPDDVSESGRSWRELLVEYNEQTQGNSLNLLMAWQLYENEAYGNLVSKFGAQSVYILSAGWGLIDAEFLTPYYDITFSPSAKGATRYKRRSSRDSYMDFCLLPKDSTELLVFIGGKDYQPLFSELTRGYAGERNVFFNSALEPEVPECNLIRYETTTRTNWHYDWAKALVNGDIRIG
jgi:hypothetical protein